jgi:hypothetical protein
MQHDRTTCIEARALVRIVYRHPLPFAGGCPGSTEPAPVRWDITERVIRVNEVAADGLTFRGICLRRQAEGHPRAIRTFHFRDVLWAERWDGNAVQSMGGFAVVPSAEMIANAMEAAGVQ